MIVNRAKTFWLVAIAIFLADVSCFAAKDSEKLKIMVGVHFSSVAGQSSAQLFDMTKGFFKIVKDKYGVEVVLKKYPTFNAVENAFLKNEIDGAMHWTGQVAEISEKGGAVHPWATIQVKKTKKAAFCLWQEKSHPISDINDVSGKTLISASYTVDWLLFLRDYLYRNGLDKPLWRVFSSFTSVSGENSAFMALAAGDVDFFWTANDYETTLKLIAPNVASQVSYSLCSDAVYGRGGFVLNKKTLSEAELKKLDATLLKLLKDFNKLEKTNSEIKAVKHYMNLVQARIAPARPDEYDYELKLYGNARKRGWITEAEFIIERMEKAPKGKPVEIKMSFDYCQKACPAGSGQLDCIDKCMK